MNGLSWQTHSEIDGLGWTRLCIRHCRNNIIWLPTESELSFDYYSLSKSLLFDRKQRKMEMRILQGEKMQSMCAQIQVCNGRKNTKNSHLMLPEKEHQAWNVLQSRFKCICLMPAFVHNFSSFLVCYYRPSYYCKNISAVMCNLNVNSIGFFSNIYILSTQTHPEMCIWNGLQLPWWLKSSHFKFQQVRFYLEQNCGTTAAWYNWSEQKCILFVCVI